jgi:tetratricopeptide (TPR) repeat protein
VSPKDSTKPKLVIIEGKDKGKVIPIDAGTTIIGRTKGDVILQDPRVSRSHVSLIYDERSGKLTCTDLKSLNGILVNGNPVETSVLVDGDRLQIGNTLFDTQLSPATEIAEVIAPPKKEKAEKPRRSTPEAPLKELNEVSHPGSHSIRKQEPGFEPPLKEFRESMEPEALSADPGDSFEPVPERPVKSHKRTLLATYREFSAIKRYSMLILVLAGGYALLNGGGKKGPPADFSREVTSLKKLEKEGKVSEALQKAEALSKAYDGDAELFVTLGELYSQQKRYEPAIAAYRKAKALNADHPVATVRLIALYLRTGLGKEAEAQMLELDRMMKEGKHSRELFVEAANLFLEFRELTRSPEKALILSRALQNELAVESTIGYKLEAQLQFQQNQNEEAMKTIQKGLERDPQDEWLLENLAFAKLSLQDTAGATEVVENWIRLHPAATKALLVMAYMKYKDKNYLAALPYLQKIIQIGNAQAGDPLVPEALNLMGQIFFVQGQSTEARTLFTQACQEGYTPACSHEALRDPQSTKPEATAEKTKPPASSKSTE